MQVFWQSSEESSFQPFLSRLSIMPAKWLVSLSDTVIVFVTYLPTYLLSHLYCDIVHSDSRWRPVYLGSETTARSEPSSTVLFRNTFTYFFTYFLVTKVSVQQTRVCGTTCHRTYDKMHFQHKWKHFCLGVSEPRRTVNVSYSAP